MPATADARIASKNNKAIWNVLILMLLVNLTASLYNLPLNRVIERRLCLEYYQVHDPSTIGKGGAIDEELCKVDDVQKQLGWLQGIMETTWVVGGEFCQGDASHMLTQAPRLHCYNTTWLRR
jgi:hypothetical protein